MAIKIKSKKQLKREQVIPFSGEENFIVPRKGGYGMSDNEDYITVARPNYSDDSYSNLLKATDESGDELLGGGSSSGGGSLSGGGSSSGGGGSSNGGSDNVRVDYAPRGEEGALPILGGGGGMGGYKPILGYAPRGKEGPLPVFGGGGGMGGSGTVRVDYAQQEGLGSSLPVYNKPSAMYAEPPSWRLATTCQELNDYKNYLEQYLSNNQNLSPADMDKYNSEMQSIVSAIPSACAIIIPDPPIDLGVTETIGYRLPDPDTRTADLPSGGGGDVSRVPDNPPPIEVLPTFPDWNILDCSNLEQRIKELDELMSVGTFTPWVASAYNKALAEAKSVYISKGCDVKPIPIPIDYAPKDADVPPPIETPKETPKETPIDTTTGTTFTPTFGGGTFGATPSGGGGGGEEKVAAEVPKKKNYSWLWLLLIAGGIYIATRKKKAA